MLNGKELQVGKSYLNGRGEIITLAEFNEKSKQRFTSTDGWHYTKTGQFYIAERGLNDLIEEYSGDTQEFNVVTKPRHYQLFPEFNIEVKDVVALLCNRLGTNGYNGAFIADFAQMLQYSMRFDEKNGKEDLEKAKEFLGGMLEKYPDVQQLKGKKQ